MSIFKKKHNYELENPVEERLEKSRLLIKDLDRKDYNKIKEAMESMFTAYEKVRKIETTDDQIKKAEIDLAETEER